MRFAEWLFLRERSFGGALLIASTLASIQVVCLLVAAYIDENFWLPAPGKGLFQHPGIAAVIISDFGLIILLNSIARRFVRLQTKIPTSIEKSNQRYIRRSISRCRKIIKLQKSSHSKIIVAVAFGFLFWLVNARQTADPITYYGNDVYDSLLYPWSYWTFRIILAMSWVALYPYAFIVISSISINIYLTTKIMIKRRRLGYSLYHPDGSCGFGYLGDLQFMIIYAIFLLYGALAIVLITHHKLNILQISGFTILTIVFISSSYLVSWPVISFLRRVRKKEMTLKYRAIRRSAPALAHMQLIWITTAASFSPFNAYQRIALMLARFSPVLVAGYRIYNAT